LGVEEVPNLQPKGADSNSVLDKKRGYIFIPK